MARPFGARDVASPRVHARPNPIPPLPWLNLREPRPLERALALGCAVLAVFDGVRHVGWQLIRLPLP